MLDKRKNIKIDRVNWERLHLTKGNKSMAKKLTEILDLYYKNNGGELEKTRLDKRTKRYKNLV